MSYQLVYNCVLFADNQASRSLNTTPHCVCLLEPHNSPYASYKFGVFVVIRSVIIIKHL